MKELGPRRNRTSPSLNTLSLVCGLDYSPKVAKYFSIRRHSGRKSLPLLSELVTTVTLVRWNGIVSGFANAHQSGASPQDSDAASVQQRIYVIDLAAAGLRNGLIKARIMTEASI
jgi:hypothetical protein